MNDSPHYTLHLNETCATRTHLDDFSNSAAALALSFADLPLRWALTLK